MSRIITGQNGSAAPQRFRSARTAGALTLTASLMLLAGCASGAAGGAVTEVEVTTDPAAVAAATEAVETAFAPPVFEVDGESFDATAAEGKKMWIVSNDLSIPISQVSAQGATDALELVGAEVTVFDGKGTVSEFVRGMQDAINDGADAIVLGGIDPAMITGSVDAAAAAGIPVIVQYLGDPGIELPEGVVAQATYDYTLAGEIMANYIVSETQGAPVGIELIISSEAPMTAAEVDGFNAAIAAGCPACTVYTDDIPIADWQTKISTQVNSTLNLHPDIEYVVPIYDGMATYAVPGIKTAGREDDVKVVSFNATQSIMEMLAAGDVVVADLGSPQAWLGWAVADQFFRAVLGLEPLEDENIGFRLFTEENIDDLDLSAPESEWYEVDYEAGYKELWQLQ